MIIIFIISILLFAVLGMVITMILPPQTTIEGLESMNTISVDGSDCKNLEDSNDEYCMDTSTNKQYAEKNNKLPGDYNKNMKSLYPMPTDKYLGTPVPDNMENSRYRKYIPLNANNIAQRSTLYKKIGKKFMKDEAKAKGIPVPYILDSDAEVLGRLVWLTYVAETEQRRSNSPKANSDLVENEIVLHDKISSIIKNDKGKEYRKKHQAVADQATTVSNCGPHISSHQRTTNQFGYRPKTSHNLEHKIGYALEGQPIHGSSVYYDVANATEQCFNNRACGGVNYDTTTGKYTLMPIHSKMVERPHYTAFIKKRHPHHNQEFRHTQMTESPYVPITGIGFSGTHNGKNVYPRDPNELPRPYNSIMGLFH